MRFFKYLFFLIAGLFIVGSFYIATLENDYTIETKQLVKAPLSVVLEEINTYKNWEYWNPYTEKGSVVTLKGSEEKPFYSWESEGEKGEMHTISSSIHKELTQKITLQNEEALNFTWNFKKQEEGTEVLMTVKGKKTFMDKVYELAHIEIDTNNTEKYKKGLEILAEKMAEKMDRHTILNGGITDFGGGFYLYITRSSKLDKVGEEMAKNLPEIMEYMQEKGISSYGKPFALYHRWNREENTVLFSCCVPVRERMTTSNNILVGFLKPHRVFKTTLKGDYKFLKEAWDDAYKNIAERGLKIDEETTPFEIYTTGLFQTQNPTKWITEIYIPILQEN